MTRFRRNLTGLLAGGRGGAILQDDFLRALKQIKYFWSLPLSQLAMLMSQLARLVEGPKLAADMDAFHAELCQSPFHLVALEKLSQEVHARYKSHLQNAMIFPQFGAEFAACYSR
jgi:hypothetical protein